MNDGGIIALSVSVLLVSASVYAVFVFLRKMLNHGDREGEPNSPNYIHEPVAPEIFIIQNLGPGPYQVMDPMQNPHFYVDNLAPPPYQREETGPSESSQEKPPDYQLNIS